MEPILGAKLGYLEECVLSYFGLWHMKLQVWHQFRAAPAITFVSSFFSEILDMPVVERERGPLCL